jgi:hypothetical protein
MQKLLLEAGNLFANHFTMGPFKELLLPKNSKFVVTSNTIAIFHPVFDFKIRLDENPRMISNVNPRTNSMEMLPDGRPRFSVYVYEATLTAEIKKFRSGDFQRPRYEAWFSRLENGVQSWFKSISNNESLDKTPLGSVVIN